MNDEELPRGIGHALRALDARAAERAARVDVERVAARVLERLRREGEERAAERTGPLRLTWMTPRALRIAAAVVVLVAAGATVRLAVRRPAASVRVPLVLPTIDSLSTRQLEAVVKAAGELRASNEPPAPAPSSRSYDDLTDQQLQTLLASLGGAEG